MIKATPWHYTPPTDKPVPSYLVQNPHTGLWALIAGGELKWTRNKSDATPVTWGIVEEVMREPGMGDCLWAYAGHKVFGGDE